MRNILLTLQKNARSTLLSVLMPVILAVLLTGCLGSADVPTPIPTPTDAAPPTETSQPQPTLTAIPMGTPTPMPIPLAERTFVPVMCYHHVRDWVKSDTEADRPYIMAPAKLEAELKYLKDNGYQAVTSEQVYEYYANGKPLPEKPIMLSFDDDDENQYTNGLPLLDKYGFKATFFIMTVTMDKENYMTTQQIKDLDRRGHDVQPHTWDHHIVTQYKTDDDWQLQIAGPRKTLEDLLGHPTPFFAYPYGVYDAASADKLKQYGYKAAFRLKEVMDDKADPQAP